MRVFIAVSLPENVLELIDELQKTLGSIGVFSLVQEAHLTLKFLGEVTPSVCKTVQEALQNVVFQSFSIHLDSLGVFPSVQTPRVLWVGVKPNNALMDLHARIDTVLKPLFSEDKQFHPHMTLARVKKITKPDQFVQYVQTRVAPLSFPVSSFHLVESVLYSGKKPVYTTISSYSSE